MKKTITYIILTIFLLTTMPVQALAQGTADIAQQITTHISQKVQEHQNKKTPLKIQEPTKKEEQELAPVPIRTSEITLTANDPENFKNGNSLYHNLLVQKDRLGLLGKTVEEIDNILTGKTPDTEKPQESSEKETNDKEDTKETKEKNKIQEKKHNLTQIAAITSTTEENEPQQQTDRYIIKYKDQTAHEKITQALQNDLKTTKQKGNLTILTTQEKTQASELLEKITAEEAEDQIEYIQPDYQIHLSSQDPYYDLQWGIENPISDESGFKIDANIPIAWEETTGQNTTIATIDTGIDITHEDLLDNIWQNPGEIPDNGLDDDQNGYIDDVNGWNFADDNNIIYDPQDDEMHGTNIAGIIAATKDNNIGIAGVAPQTKILPLKVFKNGTAYTSDIIAAIEYAQNTGIKIINCSFGANGENKALQEAIEKTDILFVCAAGNNHQNIDTNPVAPASFDLDNIISVASLNQNGHLSNFSNFGEESVDLAAPGENIITTAPGNNYVESNGTSMSAAFVTGVAALLLSQDSTSNYIFLKNQIIQSSDHLSSLLEKTSSGNKINGGNAIQGIYPEEIIEITGETPELPPQEEPSGGDFFQLYTLGGTEKAWYNTLIGPSIVNGIKETKYSAWENLQEIVSPQTGDLTLKQTDIHLPGRNGLDLEIGRIYQSNQSLFGERRIAADETSYNEYSTYYLNRYALGTGWAFTFPSVQIEKDEDQTELYYHTGTGPKYHVEFTTDPTDSNLEDYYKKDVVFQEDTTFSNGEVQSKYALITADQSQRYFAEDGRLLGIKDRFNNLITFQHTLMPITNLAPNNDFEHTETQGMWTRNSYYNYDQTTGKDDTTSLKYTSATAVSNSSFSSYIEVEPETQYQLSGYILNQLTNGSTALTYREYNSVKTEINQGTINTASSSSEWQSLQQNLTTAATTKYIRIEYQHQNAIGTSYLDKVRFDRTWPLITEITDSIGRTITFDYTDTLYEENPENAGTINITVNDPAEENTYSFTYIKGQWLVNYNWPTWSEQRRYPVLHLVDNGENDTQYDYTETDEKFSFTAKNTSGTYQNSKHPLLSTMTLRNSRINYQYGLVTKHLGEYGFYETHRITSRHEQQETATGYTTAEDNKQTYTYNGIFSSTNYDNETGYPGSYTLFENPSYYFTSSMQQTNGLQINTTFKGKYSYQTEKLHSSGEKECTTNEIYDTNFLDQPTKIKIEETNDQSETNTLYTGKTYNEWGGLASETRGLTQAQWEDTYLKNRHTIYYNYDATYKFLTQKTYYQTTDKLLSETTTYDSLGRKTTWTNPQGEISTYSYEDTNYPGNLTTLIQHHSDGKETKNTYTYGPYNVWAVTITEHYTEDGIPQTSQTTKTYEYIWGNILTSTNDLSKTTTYEYDNQGRITEVTYPPAHGENGDLVITDNIVYDGSYIYTELNDQVVYKLYTYQTKTLEGGTPEVYGETNTYYDDQGNVLLTQHYDTEREQYINTVYEYNSYGQLTTATDALSTQTTYNIDEWGRLNSVTDAQGNQQITDYDSYDRIQTTYFLPYGGTAENHYTEEYDQWGRTITRKGYPDGINNTPIQESYEYDLLGNVTRVTDARDNTTRFTYDSMNRIKRVINPLGEELSTDYDRLGDLTQIKQKEGSKTYTTTKLYDERGLLISQQPPTGDPTTYQYNSLGLPTEVTTPVSTTTLQYDDSNNLVQKTNGQDAIKYYYNPLGGIGTYEIWDGSTQTGSLSYDYTSTGLIQERTTGSNTVSFAYDLIGRMTQMNDPFGYAVGYQYDSLHRLDTITAETKTITYEYYADGMIEAVNYPLLSGGGSLRTEFTYDNINRLTELQNIKDGQIISQYEYNYDNNGNIIEIIEDDTETTYYEYDALNRLTGIHRPNGETVNYQYDVRGNRTQTTGITIKEEDFIPGEFTYNSWEELETFEIEGGATYTYEYDAEGLRIKKSSTAGTTYYHYDLNGRVISESNGSGSVTAQNVWGHKCLARKVSGSYYYYLYNGHGDVVQIVDGSGNIVNTYEYDEWGNIRSKTESIANPMRYAGEYFDEESNLYYLRARYYDPLIGRFITKDAYEGDISNPLSINQYTYCQGNPLIYVDPTGYYTQIDFSNWTGTAAQAAQLQALYTNYEAYNAGDIDTGTASGNYTSIMYAYESTTNGNRSNNEGIASQQSSNSSNCNPDKISAAATSVIATQETITITDIFSGSNPQKADTNISVATDLTTYALTVAAGIKSYNPMPGYIQNDYIKFLPRTSLTTIRKPLSVLGKGAAVIGAISIASELGETFSNPNYSLKQKITKAAVIGGGAVLSVGAGTISGTVASVVTGPLGVAAGGAVMLSTSIAINSLKEGIYSRLGL